MKAIHRISAALAALLPLCAYAQREVTPVESDDKKPLAPTLHYYDKHGKPLDEPVLFLATLDTIDTKKAGAAPIYPRLHAVDLGINVMDGILAIAGQRYGGADLWASLSMWNWLFPTLEAGVGGAHNRPDGLNYTYKGKPAFYAKIGADYNFLYKSNPQYRILAGFRAGFSSFSWTLADVTINDPYWGQTASFDITGQRGTAFYGELAAGIRVNIWRRLSLGWSFRYRFMFTCSEGTESRPWYVPGYGARDNHFGATMSLIYTIPIGRQTPAEVK